MLRMRIVPNLGFRRAALIAVAICLVMQSLSAQESKSPSDAARSMERLNREFIDHVRAMRGTDSREARVLQKSLQEDYEAGAGDAFIPDGLALVFPEFRKATESFDGGDFEAAQRAFAPLAKHADEFLAASATYFLVRSMVERGFLEEAETALAEVDADSAVLTRTPYAAHLLFLKGYAQATNLRNEAAEATLKSMLRLYPHAPEAITIGARQLLVELERREVESLDEVSHMMDYAARRIVVRDTGARVRETQDRAVDLLDRLIAEEEQKEGSCGGGSGKSASGGGRKRQASQSPRSPAERSEVQPGAGSVGELHGAPRAEPEQTWGNLPPSEREKILQSLRERFPSRYRHLVEQYYRSLAEQK